MENYPICFEKLNISSIQQDYVIYGDADSHECRDFRKHDAQHLWYRL